MGAGAVKPEELTLHEGRANLPRGPHALPVEEVATSQRGRILQAVAEVVADKGYAATTVAQVIGRARVSRSAFYAIYADKDAAYLAAYSRAADQVMDLVLRSYGEGGGWLEAHRRSLRTYLAAYRLAPAYAWAFSVEIRSAGAAAQRRRDEVMDRYAGLIGETARQARAERNLPELTREVLLGVTSSVDELVSRAIREGHLERLEALQAPLLHLHLSALVGPEFAAEHAQLS